MSIYKVFYDNHISLYCADAKSIFKPAPANDELLQTAEDKVFTLQLGTIGNTAFQIIVASDCDVSVTDICSDGVYCFSLGGNDIAGKPFTKSMPVEAGKPWPFWCFVNAEAVCGDSLAVTVKLADGRTCDFELRVDKQEVYNSSLFDGASMARLQWLNSTEGAEDTLTKGYEPVRVDGRTVSVLGRRFRVSKTGSLESAETYFTGNNSCFSDIPREILAAPMGFSVSENGTALCFVPKEFSIRSENETTCSWTAKSVCGNLLFTVCGLGEFDGSVSLDATLTGGEGRELSVQFCYEPRREFAKYFLGLGRQGCKTPEQHQWTWDADKRQDAFWCGSMNGGMFVKPTARDIERPFVNIYFHHSRNHMPPSWVNEGKGRFVLKNGVFCYDSGVFTAKKENTFSVDLMLTPFKQTNLKEHWTTHFYHKNFNMEYTETDIEDAVQTGCSHINLHHGNDTLPFLNYPMYDVEPIKKLADMAHEKGLKIKPYYTVRELSSRLPELFALRSLREEIFPAPRYEQGGVLWQKGVDPFVSENFGDEVIPAWKHTFTCGRFEGTTDPTILTNPMGRISNFYIGSLAWLIQNVGIDGLYIDDVGYNKTVMRRVCRVFEKYNPGYHIDFHTWNHFEDKHGAGYGHNMLIYMELLPYLDSLWVGEIFDYDNASAEYLLTEISGLPFGLMSEMLQGSCNVWRGMLFGMTARYPYYKWYTAPCPVPIWEMRKEFENSEMIGFWEDDKPVWADCEQVECTTYYDRKNGRMLCCFANFGESEVTFVPRGAAAGKKLHVPFIEGVQTGAELAADSSITVSAKGGIILIVA